MDEEGNPFSSENQANGLGGYQPMKKEELERVLELDLWGGIIG